MAAMISLPWNHVARERAAALADRERMRCELEKSEVTGRAADRKFSWVKSMVAPIVARHRENHFGRDVEVTYTPWGGPVASSDSDH